VGDGGDELMMVVTAATVLPSGSGISCGFSLHIVWDTLYYTCNNYNFIQQQRRRTSRDSLRTERDVAERCLHYKFFSHYNVLCILRTFIEPNGTHTVSMNQPTQSDFFNRINQSTYSASTPNASKLLSSQHTQPLV